MDEQDLIDAARVQVARTVNSTMVHAYWFIGRVGGVAEKATVTSFGRIIRFVGIR